ncbi:SEC14-like protein 2 [Acanthaster planci]|uniref:SEC14-like protein 2 n=1 Tax=Acanthaster planci TaxID=133434 RepID=A0A8B7ZKD2_ACAPL|nr:SEC14-like protein 2 [Acanthaster planci]
MCCHPCCTIMSGTLDNLSYKQQEKLTKFRINVADVLEDHHDDHVLLRFLRARKFDLTSSETLFRKDVKWKKEMQTSALSRDDIPEILKKYWPGGTCGFDKEGSPVWIDAIGRSDFKGLLYSAKTSDIIKHNIVIAESLYKLMEQQTLKLGRHVEGVAYIADMEKFGLHHLWKPAVDVFNQNASVFEQHYPETLKRVFVINAPKIFPLAYSLVKPFLQENTRKKVNILGSNWKAVLLQYIDAENLPMYWGGTATGPDGDPHCTHQIVVGGKVPESYYIKDRVVSSQDLTRYDLSRGSCLELKYDVGKPGSILRYEFKTESHDLAFGIRRIAEDGGKVDVLKKQRYNCHLVPEDGEISLQEPGRYVVRFDNSYSWIKAKTLLYLVELLEPVDETQEDEAEFVQEE